MKQIAEWIFLVSYKNTSIILLLMGRRQSTDVARDKGRRLGIVIAAERQTRKLSQHELARMAGINLDSLRGIEQGKSASPSFFTVVRIAEVLKLKSEDLIRLIR